MDVQYSKQELEDKFAEDFSNSTFPRLAEVYFLEHDFYRARKVCEIGLKMEGNNLEAQYILAKIELLDGNTIKAERILQNIYKKNTQSTKVLKLLVEVRDSLNRSKNETQKLIKILLSNAPDDVFSHQWTINNQKLFNKKNTNYKMDIFAINNNIISTTFYTILKQQKYYHQALNVLEDLKEANKIKTTFYNKEIKIINKLLSQ